MHQKILLMLQLQNQLQSVIDPQWEDKHYAWWRAIYMEASEMIDQIGWKWWKRQGMDVDQVHLELVDIYHFIMSEYLQEMGLSHSHETILNHFNMADYSPKVDDLITKTEAMILYSLTHKCSNLGMFIQLCSLSGLTFERMFELFIYKNVLNTFRQAHGYKTGDYYKDWAINNNGVSQSVEDNEFLTSVKVDWNSPSIFDDLTEKLSVRYKEVCEFNN